MATRIGRRGGGGTPKADGVVGTVSLPTLVTDPVPTEIEETSGLNLKQRLFVKEYLFGEHQGNATRAYLTVYGGESRKKLSVASAAVCGSTLLASTKCKEYLTHLSDQAAQRSQKELRPWEDLAPEAQGVIVGVLRGEVRNRQRFDAAMAILDRALGKPIQRGEYEVNVNAKQILASLRALAERRLIDGQ